MVAGAPFPDLYEWTWGEAVEFIVCYNERRRQEQRDDAVLYFRTASLLSRLVMGKGSRQYSVIDEYSHLWTAEERARIKEEIALAQMEEYFNSHLAKPEAETE